jgi:phage terminase large subunit
MQSAIASPNPHPSNLPAIIVKRWDRLSLCNADVKLQALVMEVCKHDIEIWINDWVWTYDPRRSPSMIPFLLFPRQAEYLKWRSARRSNGENGLIEKSRDMGVSWLNIVYQCHCWLFEDGYKGAFGSRKEDLVDRIGDPDSIFEKIRILLRYLPKWMLPVGFDWSKHDNFCKLLNPANGSSITGEGGDNIGRGGRSSLYDLDEAAFIERPQKVDAALSNNTEVLFYTSSVNGMNFFYQKRMNYPEPWVFRMHWKDDPRKDEQWYKGMKVKYDPVTVASEIDIDYGASVEGIYIPYNWVDAAINLELPLVGDRLAALDVATTGSNSNVFGIRHGGRVQFMDSWQGIDTTQTSYKVRELMVQGNLTHLSFDADGVGAGVAGTLSNIPDLEFTFKALHGAARPSDRKWDGEGKTSLEKFHNARAEWWGCLHERFKKTYDHVNGLADHPLDELISIPNHATLIAQISSPKRKFTSAGKILVESKDEMRARGIGSPDFADMLAYLFIPRPVPLRYTPHASTRRR